MTLLWGQYEVVRQLGEGGMSVVYLVYDQHTGQEFAAKHILPDEDLDPRYRQKVLRQFTIERTMHPTLAHPHIVRCHRVFDDGLLLNYIEGQNLRAYLSELWKREETRQLTEDELNNILAVETLQVLRHIGDALEFLHQQGWCHCDLKPDNLMRDTQGNYHLTDFGIAHRIGDPLDSERGTPEYMSPEQYQANSPLSPQTDIYSLGVTIYEMLSGQVPFEKARDHEVDTQTPNTLRQRIQYTKPPLPSYFNPNLARGIEPVLLRALEKNPEDRYQSVYEFCDALLNFGQYATAQTIIREPTLVEPTLIELAEVASIEVPPIPQAYPDRRAYLVCTTHPMPEVHLQNTNLIGRNPKDCNIYIPDNRKVSRRHALLEWDVTQREFKLWHQGRAIPTRLNGNPVINDFSPQLQDGDLITIGDYNFRFEVREPLA